MSSNAVRPEPGRRGNGRTCKPRRRGRVKTWGSPRPRLRVCRAHRAQPKQCRIPIILGGYQSLNSFVLEPWFEGSEKLWQPIYVASAIK